LLQGKGERGRTFQISRPDIGYILIIPASFSQVKGFFLSISTVGCSNSQMVAGFQTKISKSSVVTLVDRKPKTGANQSDSQTRKRTKLKAILYPLLNSEYLDVVAVARLCSFGLFT
jgi:hypothetical protein